ncbi:MAG: phosphoglucosamine mutase [Firmicutes bacterium]|nr:phosphoglucosamine mutase [Bacillota bacterium]
MGKLFGTDGVRGVANSELTPEMAFNLGKAGAYVLTKEEKERPTVVIGMDTRVSGDMLQDALSAGIMAMGANVIKVGVMPTPAIAYLVRRYGATAGVVISASHNPFEYNGIKFFNSEGFKLADEIEDEIELMMLRDSMRGTHLYGEKIGKCLVADEDALSKYTEFLKGTVDGDFSGMQIVLDCANGASYQVAERVFSELGAKVTVIGNNPNGFNINDGCGSTHPERLQEEVVRQQADCGLAFDGDADRLIAVDADGNVVDGDHLIYICASYLKKKGDLEKNLVTATVMSNMGLYKAVEEMGATVETTGVGDRYVLERMLQTGCIIGGEQSGHIIFLNHTTTGDGVLSALQTLQAVRDSGKSLGELAAEMRVYPQVLKNAKVKNENKTRFDRDEIIMKEIRSVEKKMKGDGRVLIRPSGTEPLVRVMIEGSDEAAIKEDAAALAALIELRLG